MHEEWNVGTDQTIQTQTTAQFDYKQQGDQRPERGFRCETRRCFTGQQIKEHLDGPSRHQHDQYCQLHRQQIQQPQLPAETDERCDYPPHRRDRQGRFLHFLIDVEFVNAHACLYTLMVVCPRLSARGYLPEAICPKLPTPVPVPFRPAAVQKNVSLPALPGLVSRPVQ